MVYRAEAMKARRAPYFLVLDKKNARSMNVFRKWYIDMAVPASRYLTPLS
jgi:hypothetical protein